MSPTKKRCPWAETTDLDRLYHDEEWGVPERDDNRLFEKITLEGAQAGLSWSTILKKREGYRNAFARFDPAKVARFTEKRVERLVLDPSIVRHRGKIESTISNARAVLELDEPLSEFLWGFVDGETITNRWRRLEDVPSETPLSKAMSKELKRRGFRFVGPTTCYALMQAAGMVNDHLVSCPRHAAV
ncbi:DNA-3-methyladenine glycosylase 1 [Pseudobythopirellula maris]|uniref:DNA-3-methyladenine glycosylase I n=1 Tax=Pseudobythopirellula maris TaxID=2527991 RepID=A0A5C5ZH69_9BACT|nr:DNA-3-methyladenine glycosylase I [Pseudobythopirellula maris]TWT86470.1 DNA-3-methyladenine glycosylase 1 [Pseudobythopirellula maris]